MFELDTTLKKIRLCRVCLCLVYARGMFHALVAETIDPLMVNVTKMFRQCQLCHKRRTSGNASRVQWCQIHSLNCHCYQLILRKPILDHIVLQ
jgi:hypothetical protein